MRRAQKTLTTRNGAVDVYKFILCWIIALFHFYNNGEKHFPRGDLGVEFFVMISGVYFFSACMKLTENAGGGYYEYIKKRYFRFLPYTTAAFCVSFLVNRVYIYSGVYGYKLSPSVLFGFFANDITEILLIKMSGLNADVGGYSDFLNSPVWTVSAILIVEFVIIALLSYRRELFFKVICPLSIIIGLGIWNHATSLGTGVWLGFSAAGLLKVYVVTCISFYCYELATSIRRQEFTSFGKALLSVTEGCCVAAFLAIVMFARTGGRTYIWLAILLAFFASAIAISGKGLAAHILKGTGLTAYLGRLSFAVFLMHIPVLRFFISRFPDLNDRYVHKYAFTAVVLVTSMIFEYVMHRTGKLRSRAMACLKRIILYEE